MWVSSSLVWRNAYRKSNPILQVKTENFPESLESYKPQRKIPRSKIEGRKVQSEVATSAPGGANPRLPSGCLENLGEPSSGQNDGVRDIVGVPYQNNPKAGRTLIIDARYKPRSKPPLQSTVVSNEQKTEIQSEKSTVEPFASDEKSPLLDDEIFRVPDAESSVFRTKCANVLNLVTSFVFTARYFRIPYWMQASIYVCICLSRICICPVYVSPEYSACHRLKRMKLIENISESSRIAPLPSLYVSLPQVLQRRLRRTRFRSRKNLLFDFLVVRAEGVP